MANGRSNEKKRVDSLHGYRLLDTPPEPEFDSIVKRAAAALDAPIALMSLVDSDRQWFKAAIGMEGTETPRSVSFCSYAIEGDDVMVVADARKDERFEENPLVVGDPSIRFYAGAPIVTEGGAKIGTICVIDREPRLGLGGDQKAVLKRLSAEVSAILEDRRRRDDGTGE